ncbi:MAG: hypothetical protein EBU88_17505 [Acidobacteria bacterium]|nr:hypothetical protein [Acidobacteriota bacterium]
MQPLEYPSFVEKWNTFGWWAVKSDGHDLTQLRIHLFDHEPSFGVPRGRRPKDSVHRSHRARLSDFRAQRPPIEEDTRDAASHRNMRQKMEATAMIHSRHA